MSAIVPTPLKPGDKIALVAPASVPDRQAIDRFCSDWEGRGFEIQVADSIYDRDGYLAGSDERRANELMRAFTDSSIAAVFAVRGGYGVNRIVDSLEYSLIESNPKIFAGFSDMTTLHGSLGRDANLVTFHSPHPNDGLDPERDCHKTIDCFHEWVTQPIAGRTICDGGDDWQSFVGGMTVGRLIGGNLAVLASTIGTPYSPDFHGSVLFLEDVGEPPYRVDRYLSQLRLAGCLGQVSGVVLGHFTECEATDSETSLSLDRVLEDYFGSLGVPVMRGLPSGHDLPNVTLPMNATVALDADNKSLRVE